MDLILNNENSFDNFLSNDGNLAVEVAKIVVKNPGKIYNPLLIYGGIGLGKTHLIQAIGNELKKKQ
jgi:chromosomal replication initiator protein